MQMVTPLCILHAHPLETATTCVRTLARVRVASSQSPRADAVRHQEAWAMGHVAAAAFDVVGSKA